MALNPAPEMLADMMLTVAVPVFVNVKVWLALFPTEMLPKLRLVELAVNTPAPGDPGTPGPPELALVRPAQLERTTTNTNTAAVPRIARILVDFVCLGPKPT